MQAQFALLGQASRSGVDTDIIIVGEDEPCGEQPRTRLARVGVNRILGAIAGSFPLGLRPGFQWLKSGRSNVAELGRLGLDAFQIVGVRRPPESDSGSIAGAKYKPLGSLPVVRRRRGPPTD